jgi:UDP-N-acetylglucosamine/UDP-N-acetylgalactosamine diphosphorylase
MSTATLHDRLAAVRSTLDSVEQSHILHFYDTLDEAQKNSLLAEIEAIDWPEVARLVETYVKSKPKFELPKNVEPAPYYPQVPATPELREKYKEARAHGESLIRAGKVAAFTVAGGQGTRLGWDGPKGTFPATAIRRFPLFGCLAEFIVKTQEKYNCTVPWYIMTSPVNHEATCDFLDEHDYFGLKFRDIRIFPQAMMPALDMATGKVLLASPSSLALSPNGHGGSLKALYTSGAIADMTKRGVEQISYVQIDNPTVKVVDPLFIGLHALDGAQMSSKMLPKVQPKEKLGNFCKVGGRIEVIEYSDLPDELAFQRLENGDLRFRSGSIAIHLLRRDFVASLNESKDGFALPFHRAEKKVPHIDIATGKPVEPKTPNAVKLETFVFDALPLCESSIVYETDRVEEFAPIKNADAPAGKPMEIDSPASSMALQIERAGRWLEKIGVPVTRDESGKVEGVIEISQASAIEAEDLIGTGLPDAIGPGTRLVV